MGLEAYQRPQRPVCLALGTFDGLHLGHRAVLDAVRAAARRIGGEAVATTFDPHPVTVIAPPAHPYLLTTLEERVPLFEAAGLDALLVVRFDATLREMAAADWLALLHRQVAPEVVVVSSTHTFGRGREGNAATLEAWSARFGFAVEVVPPVTNGGMVISSTAVRGALADGDVRQAAIWLGRWYSVRGQVVAGAGRGRRIGVPTANVRVPAEKVVPALGVYAAYARVGADTFPAAVNVGVRPTFGETDPVLEAHLIDTTQDLYGQAIEVAFVERLREERAFQDAQDLGAQIAADIRVARDLLKIHMETKED